MTQQLELNFATDPAPLIDRCLPAAPQDAGQLAQEGDPDQGATEADERTLENEAPRPHAPRSVVPTATLQHVIDRLRCHQDLTPGRRRDLISAIRTVARLLARPPEHVTAHLPELRKVLATAGPVDISGKRLANVKSEVSAALRLFGSSPVKRRLGGDLSAEWQVLSLACPTTAVRWRLSGFLRWCNDQGLTPEEADASVLDRFIADVDASSLAKDPEALRRQIVAAWADCARKGPNWPMQALGPPAQRRGWAFRWAEFSAPFLADTEVWISRLAGADLLAEEGLTRPLRPQTLHGHREQVRLAASALVLSGVPIADIMSLADIVKPESVRASARWLLDRNGRSSNTIHNMTVILRAIARRHVKLPQEELMVLSDICRRTAIPRRGLTKKNRDRLRPFSDQRRMDLLLTLPDELMRRARSPGRKKCVAAREAQVAVAIELLLMAAPRISNISNLRLGKHVLIDSARRDRIALVVDEDETKNESVIDQELPPESGRLIREYVARFLPALAPPGSDYLFPGRTNAIKPSALGKRIVAAVLEATGCIVNPHLFRHLGAKRHLDAHPGEHAVVQRVMGHRSIDTTINHYCGFESAAAAKHFDEGLLAGRRAAEERLGRRPRRR